MLNRFKALAAAPLAMTLFLAVPAYAVDVVNQDEADHQVTITIGDAVSELTIPAGGLGEQVCQICRLTLPDGASIDAKDDDVVVIKEGKLSKSES